MERAFVFLVYGPALRTLCLLLASAWLFVTAPAGLAQEESTGIRHNPPTVDQLQKIGPGKPLKLSIALNRKRSIDLRIRVIASVDGHLVDAPLGNPTYDEADNLVFSVELPAPSERISYQFFSYGNDTKSIESSRRFVLERRCMLAETSEDYGPSQKGAGADKGILQLRQQAEALEREVDVLGQSLSSINKIKSFTK